MSYIKRIRDNLIQCGVSLPYSLVGDLEDPKELFRVSTAIDDILYYYKILSIGGSWNDLQGFFLPLDGYYKNKMREVAYQEFMDVVDNYAKLLGADSSSVDIGLNPSMWDDDYEEEDYEDEEYEEYEEPALSEESGLVRNNENPLIGRFGALEDKGRTLFEGERVPKERGFTSRDTMEGVQGVTTPASIGTEGEKKENKGVFGESRQMPNANREKGIETEGQDGGRIGQRIIGYNESKAGEYIQTEDTEGRDGNTRYDTQEEPEKEDIGTDSGDFANLISFDSDENPDDEEVNDVINTLHSENTHSKNIFTGVPPVVGDSADAESYEEHGVYLDDITLDTDDTTKNLSNYEEHGVYLDELENIGVSEDAEYLDEIDTSTSISNDDEYVEHGIYLEELSDESNEDFEFEPEEESWIENDEDSSDGIQYDEDGFEIVNETQWEDDEDEEEYIEDNGVQYDDDGFEIVDEPQWGAEEDEEDEYSEDDGVQYDEDGFEVVDEPQWGGDDDDEYDESQGDGVQYDEDGFEIVEEESWIEDDEEDEYAGESQDDGIQYDEDGFEIVEEESWIEDDEDEESEEDYDSEGFEEVDDFGWGSSDDEDEESEEELPPKQIQETTTQQVVTPPMQNESEEVDITDKLTEGTNKILTSIKRGFAQFLSNQSQK